MCKLSNIANTTCFDGQQKRVQKDEGLSQFYSKNRGKLRIFFDRNPTANLIKGTLLSRQIRSRQVLTCPLDRGDIRRITVT